MAPPFWCRPRSVLRAHAAYRQRQRIGTGPAARTWRPAGGALCRGGRPLGDHEIMAGRSGEESLPPATHRPLDDFLRSSAGDSPDRGGSSPARVHAAVHVKLHFGTFVSPTRFSAGMGAYRPRSGAAGRRAQRNKIPARSGAAERLGRRSPCRSAKKGAASGAGLRKPHRVSRFRRASALRNRGGGSTRAAAESARDVDREPRDPGARASRRYGTGIPVGRSLEPAGGPRTWRF